MGEGKPGSDEVMDYKALAAYLKMAEGTLRHYVMEKSIPFVKVGTHVRFLKGEIDRWLLERNRRPLGMGARKEGTANDEGGELPWAAPGATALEDR
ncbi:MAG: helix-turn-helix domain-containing protein [Treponema sp.]|nr:helix-turn-helix domain-containing protein [Treponema sp.]